MATVLVTGGSGFVGAHCILQLLQAGHRVRTTVRTLGREKDVRSMLKVGGVEPGDRLSFAVADLGQDAGWAEAAAGMDYVLHVASPFPAGTPRDEDELVVPARDGTLRVLRAARDAKVRRVVVTSSFAAIGYGHPERQEPFDETSWTDPAGADVQPYIKSKTVAERAAWAFVAREGAGLELSVVNPVAVFGPVLGPDLSTSVDIVKAMMEGRIPVAPRILFGVVDVRDVADLHLRAMTDPTAAGERFLAVTGPAVSLHDVATILRARLGRAAARAPRFEVPDWAIRLLALAIPMARTAVPHLGKARSATSAKAQRMLGWSPRSYEEAILATAESLLRLGLVKAPG
jgi:dihydroflavonol-4-reductase